MVITNIIGGLGNQMFQYAAGRALSLKHKTTLLLDTSDYSSYRIHQGFELQKIFNGRMEIAKKTDIYKILGWQYLPFFRRALSSSSLAVLRHKNYIIEPHFHYWQAFNHLAKDSYLYGYWQSEKYFTDVVKQIREDFRFKPLMKKKDAELALEMRKINSISLHVRRGDYVSNPDAMLVHGLCSIDYYKKAIKYVSERVHSPTFYIFSDDILWVKNSLKIDFPHYYIDHNFGAESFNDMRLMSICKHNIIANSSFSWWGAWLNTNNNKIVVAPSRWFSSDNRNSQDILSNSWIKI